jgi:fructose-1,6-bisphosphatase I
MRIRAAITFCCSIRSTAAATSASTSPVGTIFSVLRCPEGVIAARDEDFLQPGSAQVATGYCIYGPSTMLVLTIGHGTHARIHPGSRTVFVRAHPARPAGAGTDAGVRDQHVQPAPLGSADVHRILTRGGIFIYPWDKKSPGQVGKLRLCTKPIRWRC